MSRGPIRTWDEAPRLAVSSKERDMLTAALQYLIQNEICVEEHDPSQRQHLCKVSLDIYYQVINSMLHQAHTVPCLDYTAVAYPSGAFSRCSLP